MNQTQEDVEDIDTEDEPPIRRPSLINICFNSKCCLKKKKEEEMLKREDSIESGGKRKRHIKKMFKVGGSICLVGGITTLIIGLTSGIAIIPIIIGGYFTGCGALNIMVKV